MGKPFKIKHGLICSNELLEVDPERDQVRIKGVIAATLDDLVGGGGTIGDVNNLTTDDKSSIVNAINEVDEHADNSAAGYTAISGDLAQEIIDRIDGDDTLDTKINTEITNRTNALSTTNLNLSQEITHRTTADNNLTQAISDEADARSNTDGLLAQDILDEINARDLADTAIRTDLGLDITNEATARSTVDVNLQQQINAFDADVNKFFAITLDQDKDIDLTDGNYFSVFPDSANRKLTLPAAIDDGGFKLFIRNDAMGYSFDVYNHSGTLAQSIPAGDSFEFAFDDSNNIIEINKHSFNSGSYFKSNIQNAAMNPFNSGGYQNDIEIIDKGSYQRTVQVVYNQDSTAWYLKVLEFNGTVWSEKASAVLASNTATTVYKVIVLDDTNIMVSYKDKVSIWAFNGTSLTAVYNTTLAFLSTLDILDMLEVDGADKIALVTSTGTHRYIHFCSFDGTNVTEIASSVVTLTDVFSNSFVQLSKMDDQKIVLLHGIGSETDKHLTTIETTTYTYNTFGVSTHCQEVGILDNSHLIIDDTAGFTKIYYIDDSTVKSLVWTGTSLADDLNLSTIKHRFAVIDYDYYKTIVIFQSEANHFKFRYFNFELESSNMVIQDTNLYEYSSNSNSFMTSFVVFDAKVYLGLASGITESYNCALVTQNNRLSINTYSESISEFKVAKGWIADFTSVQCSTAEADYFIGDGSMLTGIPGGYDQSLNTTDDVEFDNVTAQIYYGDGSHLTGIAAGYDQNCDIGSDVTFGIITATEFVGLPPSPTVLQIVAGEGAVNPTAIADRTYTMDGSALPSGWNIGTAAALNGTGMYGTEMGTSASDLLIAHPKNSPPFMVKVQRNKNKGFAAGRGITEFDIGWKANIANTAIRIDIFPEEEYEFWIQIIFV